MYTYPKNDTRSRLEGSVAEQALRRMVTAVTGKYYKYNIRYEVGTTSSFYFNYNNYNKWLLKNKG